MSKGKKSDILSKNDSLPSIIFELLGQIRAGTVFPKMKDPPQNSRRLKGDMKQVPH
jgi:hypothetical protein